MLHSNDNNRTCPVCGDIVATSRGRLAIYCSPKCQLVAKSRRHRAGLAKHPAVQTCVVCGTQFPQTLDAQAMKYCSRRCANRGTQRRTRGLPIADKDQVADPRRKGRICPVCNKLVPVSRGSQAIYCSPRCLWAAKRRRHRGVAVDYSPEVPTCAACGKQISQTAHPRATKYCSRRCSCRARNRRMHGLPIADTDQLADPRRQGRICPTCGRHLSVSRGACAVYCSATCQNVAKSRKPPK